ncbi:IS21 family transposase [Irregularibacter muris]|uniref:IS21 family transposase n=1 Tax=Irregularibacter muris TaxID=1796619 RepID=A0AAE3HGC3_9FIRM|nr:IS21 family transposase [Irregularibacter muris]MCR1900126.1 IS21 family transposase [Irregularibacter muris]
MLTITQVNYIRELFFLEGKTYSEIIKMTEKNYRTVKKYIEMDDFNQHCHKAKRPNKSDALRPIIRKWLTEDKSRHHKQRHTAKRIYDRLKEEHPDILKVSDRTVRNIVREEKRKVFASDDAYLLLDHPGGEAQVDFGSFEAFENGSIGRFHHLILSFPKSNAGFAVAARSETREALLEGLATIFNFIGYVPSSIWFDQMSSAALKAKDEKGRVKVADFITRFSTHYGFTIKFCNPASGNEKGNVENKVGTIRRNLFVPEPTILDIKAFNTMLLEKCLKRNKEIHYRFKEPIEKLFEEEKSLMAPVNKVPFDTAKYETRKVNKYGLIHYLACCYSVSPKYVGQSVVLKVMANEIEIFSKDLSQRITHHQRLFEKGSESINYIDFIDIIKIRPNALKYSGIYSLLPDSWQTYLHSLNRDCLKKAFDVLKVILLEDDMGYADKVLRETKKHDSISPEAIAVT